MNPRRWILSLVLAVAGAACSLAEDGPSDRSSAPTTSPAAASASASSTSDEPAERLVDPRQGGLELGFGEFAITLEPPRSVRGRSRS